MHLRAVIETGLRRRARYRQSYSSEEMFLSMERYAI